MSNKKTIKFLVDAMYQDQLAHRKDDIVELDDSLGYATRWLIYGMAEIYSGPVEKVAEKITKEITEEEVNEIISKPYESISEPEEEKFVKEYQEDFKEIEEIAKSKESVETKKRKNKLQSL